MFYFDFIYLVVDLLYFSNVEITPLLHSFIELLNLLD